MIIAANTDSSETMTGISNDSSNDVTVVAEVTQHADAAGPQVGLQTTMNFSTLSAPSPAKMMLASGTSSQ